jgi:hypothetical protein
MEKSTIGRSLYQYRPRRYGTIPWIIVNPFFSLPRTGIMHHDTQLANRSFHIIGL